MGKEIEDKIHEAAVKAMKATNLCEKHMKYHGQKTPECTPIERQMVELTTPNNDELDEIFESCRSFEVGVANSYWFDETEAKKLILNWANKKVIAGRIDELKHIQSEYGGRFNAVTYITGDDQTIEARYNDLLKALRKKGDL